MLWWIAAQATAGELVAGMAGGQGVELGMAANGIGSGQWKLIFGGTRVSGEELAASVSCRRRTVRLEQTVRLLELNLLTISPQSGMKLMKSGTACFQFSEY